MPLFPRLLTLLLMAGTVHVSAATTSSSKSKSKGKPSTSSSASKPKTSEKSETSDKPKTETAEKSGSTAKTEGITKKSETAVVKEDTPKQEPRPAAVSTISIEEIRDFDKYPKQVQSLVQSALALTHLELRYMYGSHEPNKGGMDCSGTIYHVLHFQGLKDVPRQSDEMAMWVEKKSQLHLTPTATSFDSPEFADLKPGDLLFWTNTTATTRKLPVTHVMIYVGKRKEDGKRIIFGSSDGRSFSGMRRSGVSVFDFNLPRAEGTARLHGYGPAPGLLPQEMVMASTSKPVTTPTTPASTVTAPAKEESNKEPAKVAAAPPEMKATEAPKEEPPKVAATPPYVKVKKKEEPAKVAAVPAPSVPTPPESKAKEESKPVEELSVIASTTEANGPPATESKIEVRKAMPAVTDNDGTAEAEEETPTPVVAAKGTVSESPPSTKTEPKKVASSTSSSSKPKSATSKPKTSTATKKKSVQVSSRRRTPAPPPKSQVEQAMDRAVNSVKRIFR